MLWFIEIEDQHQPDTSHADDQPHIDGVQAFFKPIRVFELSSYLRSQFNHKSFIC